MGLQGNQEQLFAGFEPFVERGRDVAASRETCESGRGLPGMCETSPAAARSCRLAVPRSSQGRESATRRLRYEMDQLVLRALATV